MTRASRFGAAVALTCITGSMLGSTFHGRAERDRPPTGHTGGFGEPLCTTCHLTADVNTGPGTLTIDGVPGKYTAGREYTLTVTVTQEQLAAGGFQLSARTDDGTQAGSFAPTPADRARLAVTDSADVQYAHHIYGGTQPVATDTARWLVLWTAPESGAVIFHAVANAADDDESPLGDLIYAVSARSQPR